MGRGNARTCRLPERRCPGLDDADCWDLKGNTYTGLLGEARTLRLPGTRPTATRFRPGPRASAITQCTCRYAISEVDDIKALGHSNT